MDNMFMNAVRNKMRFDSNRGKLTVEDLWDIPMTGKVSLDSVARGVYKELKECEDISFVGTQSKQSKDLEAKMELVKEVIRIRKDEKDRQKEAADEKARRQRIAEILEKKKDEDLLNKTTEELEAMLKGGL